MLSGELQLWHVPSILQGVLMSNRCALMGFPVGELSALAVHFVVSQVLTGLKGGFCLVKHFVNLLHRVGAQLLVFFFLCILYEMFPYPAHIVRRECAIEIVKKTC